MKSIKIYMKSNSPVTPIELVYLHGCCISITFNAGSLLIRNDLGFFQYRMDSIRSFIIE